MKAGKTLVELAQEIQRQAGAKRDYVVSTENIEMTPGNRLLLAGREDVGVTDLAHRQIAEHTGIPARYYDKMREEAPELLHNNVNAWFAKYPAPRMVRTLDGNARAVLSDRYRPMENQDLAEAVLPALLDMKLDIMSCEITERRLYIKAVDERIRRDMPTGKKWGDGSHHFFDTLSPAIIISNSEVGSGALSIEAGIFTKVCTNLAIAAQRSMKKYHTGARHDLADGILHMLSDQTRKLTDAALWSQVRDVVKGAFDEAKFNASVDELQGLTTQKIDGDPIKTVDLAAKNFGFNDGEKTSVLKHLIEGGDLSRYGLFNAITRTAQDLESYDRATEFERLGGKMIELPKAEWQELALAA